MRFLLIFLLLLAGCAAPPPPAPPAPTPVPLDLAWYERARAAGKQVLPIDTQASLIAVTVRRAGTLSRFGHDHVVASRTVEGFVAPGEQRADFRFRLDQLTVDDPALRLEAGLDTQPDQEAVEGTRTNMLGRVLEADRYPIAEMQVARLGEALVRLSVTLHGVKRALEVPVSIEQVPGGLAASGKLTLLQTDFGIVPMSVLGGALQVDDRMELRFRIVARQAPQQGPGAR